jgi:triacylglycerol esterase/lipase EstA (alpha/beta hydrolase family)
LHELGYRTCNIDYSWRYQESAKIVEEMLGKVKHIGRRYSKVHFIGHSLGGLIIRGVLTQYKPKNLGKVIQIDLPIKGVNWRVNSKADGCIRKHMAKFLKI